MVWKNKLIFHNIIKAFYKSNYKLLVNISAFKIF